jgi:Holliday junction resolvase RusA-like endonuclease
MIRIEIPGKPIGKGRARSTRDGRHYTPATTLAWEAGARVDAMVAMRRDGLFEPMNGPVRVAVSAVFEPPKSWSRLERAKAMDGPHIIKPDIDNLAKAAMDACNGIVWVDDCQVCELSASKRYGEKAMVVITVERAK